MAVTASWLVSWRVDECLEKLNWDVCREGKNLISKEELTTDSRRLSLGNSVPMSRRC
jgi:hypothetical protein